MAFVMNNAREDHFSRMQKALEESLISSIKRRKIIGHSTVLERALTQINAILHSERSKRQGGVPETRPPD